MENQLPLFDDIPAKKYKKYKRQSLGPESKHTSYKEYINSYEWRKKREKAFELLGRECMRCSEKENLIVHHRNYDNLYRETTDDVEILCKRCHPSADYHRALEKGFSTYLDNRYGDAAHLYWDDEAEYEQFCEWVENKDD